MCPILATSLFLRKWISCVFIKLSCNKPLNKNIFGGLFIMHQIYLLWQMLYNSEKKGFLHMQNTCGYVINFLLVYSGADSWSNYGLRTPCCWIWNLYHRAVIFGYLAAKLLFVIIEDVGCKGENVYLQPISLMV